MRDRKKEYNQDMLIEILEQMGFVADTQDKFAKQDQMNMFLYLQWKKTPGYVDAFTNLDKFNNATGRSGTGSEYDHDDLDQLNNLFKRFQGSYQYAGGPDPKKLAEYQKATDKVLDATDQVDVKKALLAKAENEVKALKEVLDSAEKKLQSATKEKNAAEKDLKNHKNDEKVLVKLEKKLADLKDLDGAGLTSKKLESIRKKIVDLEAKVEKLHHKVEARQDKVNKAKENLSVAQSNKDRAANSYHDAVKTLESAKNGATKTIQDFYTPEQKADRQRLQDIRVEHKGPQRTFR